MPGPMHMSRSSSRVRRFASAGLVVAAAALAGCASPQEMQGLSTTTRALEERNIALQHELETKEATVTQLQDRVAQSEQTIRQLRSRNGDLQADLLQLREEYRRLGEQLANVGATPLDPLTDQALRRFASRNPNVAAYDSDRGMLRLASDLTFGSGSAELSTGAEETVSALADLLNSAEASQYDIRIVGHTDNVPVSASRNRHPTNMHLSAHRAISVHAALRSAGVAPERMEIAGWGPFRPVVPNPATGGASQNRRVEIYLVPRTSNISTVPVEADDADRATSRQRSNDPIK